ELEHQHDKSHDHCDRKRDDIQSEQSQETAPINLLRCASRIHVPICPQADAPPLPMNCQTQWMVARSRRGIAALPRGWAQTTAAETAAPPDLCCLKGPKAARIGVAASHEPPRGMRRPLSLSLSPPCGARGSPDDASPRARGERPATRRVRGRERGLVHGCNARHY